MRHITHSISKAIPFHVHHQISSISTSNLIRYDITGPIGIESNGVLGIVPAENNGIGTNTTVDSVVTLFAFEHIIPGLTQQAIIQSVPIQIFSMGAAVDVGTGITRIQCFIFKCKGFNMGQLVSTIPPRHTIRYGKHQAILVETDRVVSEVAAEHGRVVTASTIDGIIAAVAADSVFAIVAIDGVISIVPSYSIVPISSINSIISTPGRKRIITSITIDVVSTVIHGNSLSTGGTVIVQSLMIDFVAHKLHNPAHVMRIVDVVFRKR